MNKLLLNDCKNIEFDLKNEFLKIEDIKLAFIIGSFNKKYFSRISDIDVVIILNEESFEVIKDLSNLRQRLQKKYFREIDFMINNLSEFKLKIPLCELNDFVITNLKDNKYCILKNTIKYSLISKYKQESTIQDARYFFNKLRNMSMGTSFFIRGKYKKVIGTEKTKIAISCLFNILRRYIIINSGDYIEEYDEIIKHVKKESLSDAKLLDKLYLLKKSQSNLNKKDFEQIYDYSLKMYNYILRQKIR